MIMIIIYMVDNMMTVLIITTELYHDRHGPDGCGIYCVARGVVDADVSHWSENRGPVVSHWSDNVRHNLQKGDVIPDRFRYVTWCV